MWWFTHKLRLTHIRAASLGVKQLDEALFFIELSASSNQMFFCSSLGVISLKLKAQRQPQQHSKALNDIARQVRSKLKEFKAKSSYFKVDFGDIRVLHGINPRWNVSFKAFLWLQALKMLSFPIFYPLKLSLLLKVLLFHVLLRGYADRVGTLSFQTWVLLLSFSTLFVA